MPGRDEYGNEVYSQGEYEHHVMMGIPFTGFVEGMGYVLPEIVVTPYPINNSGTHFMFDIDTVEYTLDMSEMVYPEKSTQSEPVNNTPDRSDYWRMANCAKVEYRDDGWKYIQNPAAFANNVLANICNVIPWAVNSVAVPSQIVYHEGFDAFIDNEKQGVRAMANAPINYVVNTYNYTVNTPFSQQMSDFWRDMRDVRQWERTTAFATIIFIPGGVASKAGTLGRGSGMLTRMPTRAYLSKTNLFQPYFTTLKNATGGTKQWVRFGSSYSHNLGIKIRYSIRWGASPKYAPSIGNIYLRILNQELRKTKLPGNNWRVKDAGHFHIKK